MNQLLFRTYNIFHISKNEVVGMEDARFVKFTDDDGSVTYYATYTAAHGQNFWHPANLRQKIFEL